MGYGDGGKLFGGSVAITRRPMGGETEFVIVGDLRARFTLRSSGEDIV